LTGHAFNGAGKGRFGFERWNNDTDQDGHIVQSSHGIESPEPSR
jgi:hypothetical protein